MVSVASASRNITSASCYHPRYQSRSSMYIRGLIPRNFAELADAVPISMVGVSEEVESQRMASGIVQAFYEFCIRFIQTLEVHVYM